MWKYEDTLIQILSDYEPPQDQNSYAPRITITSAKLIITEGPDYHELAFQNGVYVLRIRLFDMRGSIERKTEYKSEEEALFHWLMPLSLSLPKDSKVSKNVDNLSKHLFDIIKEQSK